MYSMKNITKYLTVAALLFTAACSKTQESTLYTPAPDDAKEIHFIQSSIEKEFAKDAPAGKIDVQIARTGNQGTYTVTLLNKGDNAELFGVPATVTIPDGEYSVTVPVPVDLSKFIVGGNYKTTIYIKERDAQSGGNGASVSQFSDKITLAATFELEWEPYYRTNAAGENVQQLATYYYAQFYTGADRDMEVEKAVGTNIFRLLDWASGVAFRFILHDDGTCTVPAQSIGYLNTNYNEYVFVSDMAVYNNNDAYYDSYPCTYDGKGNFAFYLIYYVSQGYFGAGVETMSFDSEPDTTPAVDIVYKDIVATETGFRAPKLAFSPNSHTKFYKATVVTGDVAASEVRMEEVRRNLIADVPEGNIPIVTYYEATEGVWNVPKGSYSAVALPYDNEEKPGELIAVERFTCDPEKEYAPKFTNFKWYAPTENPLYSAYNTIFWEVQAINTVRVKYLCVQSAILPQMMEAYGMNLEELTENMGNEFNEATLEVVTSPEGFTTYFSPMNQGSEYTLCAVAYNQFGDKLFVTEKTSTSGRYAKDFDQTKTQADFIGAYSATAVVSKKNVNFRIDIMRVNDTEMIIRGMSDMRDFTPELRGYYDKERHMIVVEPQPASRYNGYYAMLGMYDGLSLYWGSAGLAIGYIGDTLYWAASPHSSIGNINGYMFLLFNSEQASGSTYIKEYVGSKIYTDMYMKPIKSKTEAAKMRVSNPITEEVKGHAFDIGAAAPVIIHQFTGIVERPKSAANAASATAPGIPGTKTLRQDMVLRTR